jgi:hypothetical protein
MTKDQSAPPLSGPSGYGLSLTLSASPAVLPRDGSSLAIITATARDAEGKGVPNVRLVATVSPDSMPLAQLNMTTTSDGTARFQLTAPPTSTVASNNEVTIWITPIGDDFQNAVMKPITLGLLGPSNATYPTPAFTISPEAPAAGTPTVFDASTSTDEGVACETCNFRWVIRGEAFEGRTAEYVFPSQGAYAVTLTATDQTGSARSITQAVQVGAAPEVMP